MLYVICTWMRKLLYDRDFNLEINSFANRDLEKACLLFENVEEFLFRSIAASLSNKKLCDFFT